MISFPVLTVQPDVQSSLVRMVDGGSCPAAGRPERRGFEGGNRAWAFVSSKGVSIGIRPNNALTRR